jgi:hypothetical protein
MWTQSNVGALGLALTLGLHEALLEVAHQIPNSRDNRPSLTVEGEAIGQQNDPVQAHIF